MSPRNNGGLGHNVVASDEIYMTPAFDLFSKQPNENGVKQSTFQKFFPITSVKDSGPYEFRILTADHEFLYAPLLRLGGVVRIVKTNGDPLNKDDDISVCNLPIDSLFQSIVIEINQVKIEDTSYSYGYKAFLEKTLSFDTSAKNTHLLTDVYHADSPGKFDSVTSAEGNVGFLERKSRFEMSKPVNFHIPLSLDISTISKPLPNNSTYTFRFSRNPDSFVLLGSGGGYKIQIEDLYLEIMKIMPTDIALNRIKNRFQTEPMIYPITRSKLLRYSIPKGSVHLPSKTYH